MRPTIRPFWTPSPAIFQQIYGSDAYPVALRKDGQLAALVALAIHDANNTAISVYRSFTATALGDALIEQRQN